MDDEVAVPCGRAGGGAALSARDAGRLAEADADVVVEPYSSASQNLFDHIIEPAGDDDGEPGRA